ncbi:hypothetical protein K2W90_02385 [Candidatus Babeliales bacterium]|nr:hypothetical protein [Candidatus Babeliales bacterium]
MKIRFAKTLWLCALFFALSRGVCPTALDDLGTALNALKTKLAQLSQDLLVMNQAFLLAALRDVADGERKIFNRTSVPQSYDQCGYYAAINGAMMWQEAFNNPDVPADALTRNAPARWKAEAEALFVQYGTPVADASAAVDAFRQKLISVNFCKPGEMKAFDAHLLKCFITFGLLKQELEQTKKVEYDQIIAELATQTKESLQHSPTKNWTFGARGFLRFAQGLDNILKNNLAAAAEYYWPVGPVGSLSSRESFYLLAMMLKDDDVIKRLLDPVPDPGHYFWKMTDRFFLYPCMQKVYQTQTKGDSGAGISTQYLQAGNYWQAFLKEKFPHFIRNIRKFRQDGSPQFIMYNPNQSHWTVMIMTTKGLFCSDSIGGVVADPAQKVTNNAQKNIVYDLFTGRGPYADLDAIEAGLQARALAEGVVPVL